MNQKYILFSLFFIFSALFLFSQTGTIKGRIYNARNNEPIPLANIIIYSEPTQGTTSDIDGNFTLNGVKPGYTKLVTSYLGFEKTVTEEVLVTLVHIV